MNKIILPFLVCLLGTQITFAQCEPQAQTDLSVNNVNAGLLNGGDMFWDLANAHYEVPKNSGKNTIFAAAIWMGGIDTQGNLKAAAQTYRQSGSDFFPGPVNDDGTLIDTDCVDFDKFWKVTSLDIDAFKAEYEAKALAGQTMTVAEVPQTLLDWPGKNNPHFTEFTLPENKELAPFWDANADGVYNPIEGDYPVINSEIEGQYADEMVWWVYNDLGGFHGETQAEPIGMEVGALAYAFQSDDYINDATFYRYRLNYNGDTPLNDFYIGHFFDADLGNFTDDYVGCDTTQNMGYIYNGDDFDDGATGYGDNPPMLGVKVIEGLKDENGGETKLSSFIYYNNDFDVTGNPEIGEHYYNYLKATWKDGTPVTEGGNGYGGTTPTNYMSPGNPSGEGWSECSDNNVSADRRFVLSTGPINLDSGSEKFVTFGILYLQQGEAVYPCPDVAPLSNLGAQSEVFFDSLQVPIVFEIPEDTANTIIKSLYFNDNISIYPNPMTEKSVIDLSKLTEQVDELTVYNQTGKKVLQQPINNQTTITINRGNLTNGLYYYQLKNKESVIANGKVVVQ